MMKEQTAMPTGPLDESHIAALVRRFYELSLRDSDLGPLFRAHIPDFEEHYVIVGDFWSQALLGTNRYGGQPYAKHMNLPMQPVHFDRWLACFSQAAGETLPPDAASRALQRASQMIDSFRAGLLPLPQPARRPARPKP